MKYLSLTFILLIIASCSQVDSAVEGFEAAYEEKSPEAITEELNNQVEKLWSEGYPSKDTATVSSLYHSNFKLIDDEGTVFSKEDELRYVADYGDQYENFSYTIEDVVLYENGSALVIARCKFLGTSVDGAFSTEYLQSLTFTKINREWKIIYSHVSGVKEESIQNAPE